MERSSFRARLFFIAGPAAAIVWSVYAAILTADARQRAAEADIGFRHQVRRVDAARRRFARARHEAMLIARRNLEAGLGADALALGGAAVPLAGTVGPLPASLPGSGVAPVNGAAVVNAGAVGDAPAAPGAEHATALAESALAAEAQAAGADAHGLPGAPGASAPAAPVATAPAASATTVTTAGTAPQGFAAAGAALVAAGPPMPGTPDAVAPAMPGTPASSEGEAPVVKPAGAPRGSVAIARAAASERAHLIAQLREKLGGIRVQVDEIRLGSAHEEGEEWVRTVRIQLSGRKELVKKAVANLKTAAPVRELSAGKLEPVKGEDGEMRTTVTGKLQSSNPGSSARG